MHQSGYRRNIDGFGHKMFPSPTAGQGKLIKPYDRDTSGQGQASSIRKIKCRQCGFPVDISRTNISGGSSEGNGGYGPVTEASSTGTVLGGGTFTDTWGDRTVPAGSGCSHCGSRNCSREGARRKNRLGSRRPNPI